jgi:hypothetical protein
VVVVRELEGWRAAGVRGVVVPMIGVHDNGREGRALALLVLAERVSGMREIRIYGWKGGWGNGLLAAPHP